MLFHLSISIILNSFLASCSVCLYPNCVDCYHNQITCTDCSTSQSSTYDLVNGQCLASPCEGFGYSISGASACNTCSPGFPILSNGTCAKDCGEYCLDCYNNTCTSCANLFYLSNSTCSACRACVDWNNCEQCIGYYSLGADGFCSPSEDTISDATKLMLILVIILGIFLILCW